MKINKEELYKLYMEWVDEVAEECDWKTTFGPKEIVEAIATLLENNPHLYMNKEQQELKFDKEIIFDNKEVEVTLPGGELSDADNLEYFFHQYLSSVKRGKPNQRMANNLKTLIDIIQVKTITNEK